MASTPKFIEGGAADPISPNSLLNLLRTDGVIGPDEPVEIVELAGGVSSDIHLVRQGARSFVVKRAREKLRVKDDWFSDPIRNTYEQRYLKYVGSFLPQAVPRVLFSNEKAGYFAMEYLGDGYSLWKNRLLAGEFDATRARQVMEVIARIHAHSRGRPEVARDFDTTDNFRQLRTDPYLRTTGERHPELQPVFSAEAERLEGTHECLVHGDFSPKNILLGVDRVVLLDCEVAWYGDPSFDIAFLLNHLCLKALHHAPADPGFPALFNAAVSGYFEASGLDARARAELDLRSARLLPLLLLARIDGKSPVEYLADERKRAFVRRTVTDFLHQPASSLGSLAAAWSARLRQNFPPA